MIRLYIFILVFLFSNVSSLEIKCNFEEVYSDSSIQNGFFLIKDKKLRYEYYSPDLFTLFHNNDQFLFVKNNDRDVINRVSDNTEIIQELMSIASKYPDIEKEYISKNLSVNIEKELDGNFVKRISIISPQTKMSIYLNDCKILTINDRFFSHNPFFEYKFN